MIRQQRLLEKVAILGSSPINVIQSIAAKALNFKLKNSQTWIASGSEPMGTTTTAATATGTATTSSFASASSLNTLLNRNLKETDENASSKQSLINYNRLLRQYKFLKSTNIRLNNQSDDKARHLLFLNQLVSNQHFKDHSTNKDATNKKMKTQNDLDDDDDDDDEDDEQEIFNSKMFFMPSEKSEPGMDVN